MQQNAAAPVVAGASAIGGMAALIFGLFAIGDCMRFQTARGECDDVVKENSGHIVLGFFAAAGAVGGFFTINPMLDRRKKEAGVEPAPAEPFVIRPTPIGGAQWGGEDENVERVQFMAARGLSIEQIAEATGVEPAAVEQILASATELEPGL